MTKIKSTLYYSIILGEITAVHHIAAALQKVVLAGFRRTGRPVVVHRMKVRSLPGAYHRHSSGDNNTSTRMGTVKLILLLQELK